MPPAPLFVPLCGMARAALVACLHAMQVNFVIYNYLVWVL